MSAAARAPDSVILIVTFGSYFIAPHLVAYSLELLPFHPCLRISPLSSFPNKLLKPPPDYLGDVVEASPKT